MCISGEIRGFFGFLDLLYCSMLQYTLKKGKVHALYRLQIKAKQKRLYLYLLHTSIQYTTQNPTF